jgi:hypothetical protein
MADSQTVDERCCSAKESRTTTAPEQTREAGVALGPWSEDLGHLVAALWGEDGAAAYVPGVEVVDR